MLAEAMKYKVWADVRTVDAVRLVDRNVYPDAHAFMLQQLNHMVIVEELFISRIKGEVAPHSSTNTIEVPELDELEDRLSNTSEWLLNFVSEATESQKTMVHRFVFADGKKGTMSVEEMLFHIVNHGSYHRGSIAHSLDLSGVAHPVDGYGIYIHSAEPERRNH